MPHSGCIEISGARVRCPHPECPLTAPAAALAAGHDQVIVPPSLTPQQRAVVAWLANGLSAKEIGSQLGLACDTVRGHIKAAKGRLGYRSSAQLIHLAARSNWKPYRCDAPTAGTGAKPVDHYSRQ